MKPMVSLRQLQDMKRNAYKKEQGPTRITSLADVMEWSAAHKFQKGEPEIHDKKDIRTLIDTDSPIAVHDLPAMGVRFSSYPLLRSLIELVGVWGGDFKWFLDGTYKICDGGQCLLVAGSHVIKYHGAATSGRIKHSFVPFAYALAPSESTAVS